MDGSYWVGYALATMGTFCWAALNLRAVVPFSRILSVVGVLVLVQIFYAALTAGLRAGCFSFPWGHSVKDNLG